MLLCHNHVDMVLSLVPSFRQNLQDEHALWVFNDGSLTGEDLERIGSAFSPERVIPLEEAEDLVRPKLKSYPNLLRLREEHIMLRKLLDLPLVAGQPLALVDSDVTAVRPFTGLDRRGCGDEPIVMMQDLGEAYSMTYRHRHFGAGRVPLIDRANAGFMYINFDVFDLGFFEHFVSEQDNISRSSWLIEQTAWAALAARVGGYHFDPAYVDLPPREPDRTPIATVMHFISRLRHVLDDPTYLETLFRTGAQQPPVQLPTRKAPCSGFASGLAKKSFRRAFIRGRYVQTT